MDRNRIISLVESEILRKKEMAKLCNEAEAIQHLTVAEALRVVLTVYQKRDETWF